MISFKKNHNKKRNTSFLYEALMRELAKSVLEKNLEYRNKIVKVIKEHFNKSTILYKELNLYKSILDTNNLNSTRVAEKLLNEVYRVYSTFNKQEIFDAQSKLIEDINKSLSPTVMNNFIPNYKNLASLSLLFNGEVTTKQKVILEERIIKHLVAPNKQIIKEQEELEPIDNIVYKQFVSEFNKTYGETLNEQQSKLVTYYLTSFNDEGVELKTFLNEELVRLRQAVIDSKLDESKDLLDRLNEFRIKPINEDSLKDILLIQELVKEI